MTDSKNISQACQLVGFDKATIFLHEELPITPDPATFQVEGVVNSLGVSVALHNSGIEVFGADAWYIYEVVGCGMWAAIGSRNYTASAVLASQSGTKGVKLRGANGQMAELPWSDANKFS